MSYKRKKLLSIILGFCFFLLIGLVVFQAGMTLYLGQKLYCSVVGGRSEEFDSRYRSFQKSLGFWLVFGEKVKPNDKYLRFAKEAVLFLPELLGRNGEKIYLVLLQNNMELRPSGGFMGSYAKVKFKEGVLSGFEVQDIYVPDGQILGHVEPPAPIQEAFGQGWWKLRDANWDPDFPASSRTVNWFFEKGGEEKADGIVAVNLILFREILGITGPVALVNYAQAVNRDNFYQTIQAYAEVGFFPGSTQKKDILSEFGLALWEKIKAMNRRQTLRMVQVIFKNLNEKQILVSVFNDRNTAFGEIGWDGSLGQAMGDDGFLYLVETNLGANKANCCVERRVMHQVAVDSSGERQEDLTIYFKNNSRFESPVPPVFWGGNYINYQRVYLPLISKEIKVKIDGQAVEDSKITFTKREKNHLLEVGFWVRVKAQTEETVEISYEIPGERALHYRVLVQKQPGLESFPYRLELEFGDQKIIRSWEIRQDTEISIPMKYN